MDYLKCIKERRSVRTFDGSPLSAEHLEKLNVYLKTITNPYGIPVDFYLLDKAKYGLSSPVITGETMYVTAKVKPVPHSEEAFGYSFELLVLYAQSLGIGTTWIGGTMKRAVFENAVQLSDDERMYCVSPIGYPAKKMSLKETAMRLGVKADQRKPSNELFFENDFSAPLHPEHDTIKHALEAVRLAPSAVNKQPWRIVKCENAFHFYEKHNKGYSGEKTGDMQKIDIGIALCHFILTAGGNLTVSDPGIQTASDMEYIATVSI
ncbi:MAG TPA: nitroreductase [Ruminococcus sp.]|nr:nitroreductase [Ruminococcus sp.]